MPPLSKDLAMGKKSSGLTSSSPLFTSDGLMFPKLVPQTSKQQSRTCNVRCKRVRFCEVAHVEETIHVLDYTLQEMVDTWYDKEEIRQFKADRTEFARRMNARELPDLECTLGMESQTISGSRIRQESILTGLHAVLDEQELQDLDGAENHEMIAHIYSIKTVRSVQIARDRGQYLANEL